MKIDLEMLNTNQRKAVEWNSKPLLVLAGPGSGKTSVLTMRIARLISESEDQRFRILGLTFTNKAAGEMRKRIDEMLTEGRERALITTFHSFSADVLRQHGSHIGIKPDFVILNQESDRESVLVDAIQILQEQAVDVDKADVKLLPLIDKLLENCVSEDVASRFQDRKVGEKVALLYAEYRRQLSLNNQLDYPSLLCCTYELLTNNPVVADQLNIVYTHICIDEFQDTNLAQYNVLRAIARKNYENLVVVADDDQIIYQWNGASPERLRQLRRDFKMQVIQLPDNYRCPPEVIEIANKLINHNADRSADKEPLNAVKTTNDKIVIRTANFNSFENEIEWVASDIQMRGINQYEHCVVLARTKKLLDQMAQALVNSGITASLVIRKNEFESIPFRWLHAILRLANARGDREQLRRICKAFYELEGINIEVQDIVAYASIWGGDYLRSWVERVLERHGLEPNTRKFISLARDQIVNRLDFSRFIDSAIDWFTQTKFPTSAEYRDTADFEDEKNIWVELQKQVIDKYGDGVTLQTLLQEFDLSPKSPPVEPNSVRCFTIHSSKGMEFQNVYLIGLVEDQLPSYASIKKGEESHEMQEERRSCFVAITRAQESLTLTYAQRYFGWAKSPSRFLYEMELLEM